MRGIQRLGRICNHSNECPVYKGDITIDGVDHVIVRNVFCNRGEMGWKNCKRYQLVSDNKEVPETATPYKTS